MTTKYDEPLCWLCNNNREFPDNDLNFRECPVCTRNYFGANPEESGYSREPTFEDSNERHG